MDNQNQEFKYEPIPGFKAHPLADKETLLEGNKFAKYSLEELKELFDQYRFFFTNGYTPKGTELERIREELCNEISYGATAMQTQLLIAIAVKTFWND